MKRVLKMLRRVVVGEAGVLDAALVMLLVAVAVLSSRVASGNRYELQRQSYLSTIS